LTYSLSTLSTSGASVTISRNLLEYIKASLTTIYRNPAVHFKSPAHVWMWATYTISLSAGNIWKTAYEVEPENTSYAVQPERPVTVSDAPRMLYTLATTGDPAALAGSFAKSSAQEGMMIEGEASGLSLLQSQSMNLSFDPTRTGSLKEAAHVMRNQLVRYSPVYGAGSMLNGQLRTMWRDAAGMNMA
jgi:hypothetical protein